ncbi:MAG: NAD(P)H-dependent oxidoreductase subunit E [Chloroflexota bacterium]|jgi:bidirectional [NiFe] hydrogenase diaphorase subunit
MTIPTKPTTETQEAGDPKEACKHFVPDMSDKRWKLVAITMKKNNYNPRALIEVLHVIQDSFGYIDYDAMGYVAREMKLPFSKVYGVVTFYHGFMSKPAGEHTMVLCTGTACYVKGADVITDWMKERFGLDPNQTTPDNKLSFIAARCIGACGLAPVMILDGQIVGKLSVDEMKAKIEEWIGDDNQ